MNKQKIIERFKKLLKSFRKTGYIDKDVYLWTDEEVMLIFEYSKKSIAKDKK